MDMTDTPRAGAGHSEALIEESILPTSLNQRPIGMLGYAWMWVGIAVIIATYSLGAGGVEGGLPLAVVFGLWVRWGAWSEFQAGKNNWQEMDK